MPDVFGRSDAKFGGGLSADELAMTFSGAPSSGLLVQNFGLQYQQPIRRIYDLSDGKLVYYVIGRPEGSWQMARIFGVASLIIQFYQTYGDPCNPNTVTLTAAAGCSDLAGGPETATWTMDGFVVSSVGMNASAQEMLIQENNTGVFTNLNLS